jgi:hypothetical protein
MITGVSPFAGSRSFGEIPRLGHPAHIGQMGLKMMAQLSTVGIAYEPLRSVRNHDPPDRVRIEA